MGRPLSGETCIYCDALLPTRYERDHFPIPAWVGGTEIVNACMTCHELKDRTPLSDWPADYLLARMLEMPARAQMVAFATLTGRRRSLELDLFDMLEDWDTMAPRARVALAKITRAVAEMALLHRSARWGQMALSRGRFGCYRAAE